MCVGLDVAACGAKTECYWKQQITTKQGKTQEGALPPEAASADGQEGGLTVASRTRFAAARVTTCAAR